MGNLLRCAMGNRKSHGYDYVREMPPNVRELHYAVMSNDRETVRTLLQQGVNVNFPWYNPSHTSVKDGSTPLICAVSLNHLEIIELLLRHGAYINKCDRNGCTPVYKASFHGRPGLIEQLSRAGADVNLADYMGKTPLYICVNNAIVHTSTYNMAVHVLIVSGAIIDKSDKLGQAPVHLAAHWKLTHIIQQLINNHSNVNIVDRHGRTPLYVCVSSLSTNLYAEDLRHQLPIIIILHKHGADMLNLIEWLLFKGSGIPEEIFLDCRDSQEFVSWYRTQLTTPKTLKNICRKVIQKNITCYGRLGELASTLPLPSKLRIFVSRKMFYRENNHPHPGNAP